MSIRTKIRMARHMIEGLYEHKARPDPILQFKEWYDEAGRSGLALPDAMTLATADPDGTPSARMMLLKDVSHEGFRFYTNFDSRKGRILEQNPRVALVFHWAELQRQVRVEGVVEKLSQEESDTYFQSRPRGSRIGAWASAQSAALKDRQELEQKVEHFKNQFAGTEVPLPPFWGGYLVRPSRIEFWQGRVDRLHDRLSYTRDGDGWKMERLSP